MDFRIVSADDPKLIALGKEIILEYQQEIGVDFCFHGFAEELDSFPGEYAGPTGQFLLVFNDDQLVACGALRDLGNEICELKRIYVRPIARRQGLARSISERLIAFGKHAGYRAVRLDTLQRLSGAIELYRDLGFEFIAPYNNKPDLDIVYMEKTLGSP